MPAMARDRREATLRGWMEALPDEIFRTRPSLVWALPARCCPLVKWRVWKLDCGTQSDGRCVGPAGTRSGSARVVDADAFRRLPGTIAIYRSGQALAAEMRQPPWRMPGRALDLLDEDDHVFPGGGRGA